MKRVLVTGANGYIGQHLALALVQAGWLVRGMSRSPRPHPLDGIDWVSGDIADAGTVMRAMHDCECVAHLACLPLKPSADDPLSALRVNVQGVVQLLESARWHRVNKFVFVSTAQVYGGQARLPNVETDLPQPDSPYAASKLSAEVWCQAYARAFGLPIQILRLFNVYGVAVDGSPRPTIETLFLNRLKQGQCPQVRNAQSGRDFIYISDVVRAIVLALGSSSNASPLNIGTGKMTTLVELARLAARVCGSALEPEIIETGESLARYQADVMHAQTSFGFRAQIPLEQGLAKCL